MFATKILNKLPKMHPLDELFSTANTGNKPSLKVVLKIIPDAKFSHQKTTSGIEITTCHSAYGVRQPNGTPGETLLDIIDSKADY